MSRPILRPGAGDIARRFQARTVRPVDFVERVRLLEPAERERAILDAVDRLVAVEDVVGAAKEIAVAFMRELPVYHEPEPEAAVGFGPGGESMARRPDPSKALAPAATPGVEATHDESKIGPLPEPPDDRREFSEFEAAAKVLTEATLRRIELRDFAMELALDVRLLSSRAKAPGLAVSMRKIADGLRDASRASGTEGVMFNKRTATSDLVDAAVAKGASTHEAEAISTYSREWELLRDRGLTTTTRDRYVQINMDKWRERNA